MAEIPYTTVPGTLKKLLQKIREVKKPDNATYNWLSSIGFKSTNAKSTIRVLKHIDFLDKSGVPTERWNQYRDSHYQQVLGSAIRDGYAELYSTFPSPHELIDQELWHYFSSKSGAGKRTVDLMVSTGV